mmetsp:Transcript_2090/g.5730  ORF Transcript_2090/g.5730 Transcript_2090/m.5730 type:complete len:260 (+) Transcript_2090:801-1580(+)
MLVNSANAGHGPVGRRDDDAVARVELLWKLAIEAHLRRRLPALRGQLGPDHHGVRQDSWTERERVGADWRQQDGRIRGGDERAACGERIGGRARRRGDDDAVSLCSGDKLVVDVDIQHTEEGCVTAIDDDLVQREPLRVTGATPVVPTGVAHQTCARRRLPRTAGGFGGIVALPVLLVADPKDAAPPAPVCPHDATGEAHARGEVASALNELPQLVGMLAKVEGSQEAERAHREGEDGRHCARKERRGPAIHGDVGVGD